MSDQTFEASLRSLVTHGASWTSRLKKAEEAAHRQQCAKWRRRLTTHNGRPTRTLFKWLKQGSRRGHYITRVGKTYCCGSTQFFEAQRGFWGGLMNRDSTEAVSARVVAESEHAPLQKEILEIDVQLLFDTLQSLNQGGSGGLDVWPPSALRAISFDACRPLAWLLLTIEHSRRWPSTLLDIRVQLVPKTDGQIPSPDEHRPISVTSAWC